MKHWKGKSYYAISRARNTIPCYSSGRVIIQIFVNTDMNNNNKTVVTFCLPKWYQIFAWPMHGLNMETLIITLSKKFQTLLTTHFKHGTRPENQKGVVRFSYIRGYSYAVSLFLYPVIHAYKYMHDTLLQFITILTQE